MNEWKKDWKGLWYKFYQMWDMVWKLDNITTQPHFTKGWEPSGMLYILNCPLLISGAATVEKTVLDWIAEMFGFDKTRY